MPVLRTMSCRSLRRLVVVSVFFLATPPATIAEQASIHVGEPSFVLSTGDGTLSLKAKDAPLKEILEQIGEELNIQVDAQVAEDETVTEAFRDLPIDEALQRLVPNYVVITGKNDEQITKIVILPRGEVAAGIRVDTPAEKEVAVTPGRQGQHVENIRENDGAKPFKFEFDPSAVMSTD